MCESKGQRGEWQEREKEPGAGVAFIAGGLGEPLTDHVADTHDQTCILE